MSDPKTQSEMWEQENEDAFTGHMNGSDEAEPEPEEQEEPMAQEQEE